MDWCRSKKLNDCKELRYNRIWPSQQDRRHRKARSGNLQFGEGACRRNKQKVNIGPIVKKKIGVKRKKKSVAFVSGNPKRGLGREKNDLRRLTDRGGGVMASGLRNAEENLTRSTGSKSTSPEKERRKNSSNPREPKTSASGSTLS